MSDKIDWRVTSAPGTHDRERITRNLARGFGIGRGLFWIAAGVVLVVLGVAGVGGAVPIVFGLVIAAFGIWQILRPARL